MNYNTSEQMEIFKRNIINAINSSELSIDIVYYILKDLLQEISIKYNDYQQQVVQQIIQKQQRAMQDKKQSDIVEGE